ncbi:hypothetical protein [Corynebacterium pilosum]|uniref:Uncharacterized protein n=1 Tax=Corynebacterium pilosum TaxID=35756 RepID=A0A376CJ53_9CORY|nr:hypothetical protein [Corynebacterium pilosum]STC68510.1 Uncharacterised protein [Corynebacterium pilosum]
MTTTLAAPAPARITDEAEHHYAAQQRTYVLQITGMPVHLRGTVENLMADYLPPAEIENTPGIDIWDITWFTRWQRDTTTFGARGLRCREVITAPEASEFTAALEQLAHDYGFRASVVEA